MIKVTIKKQNIISHSAIFSSQEQADEWVLKEKELKSFGNPEINEEVLNENGEITINRTPSEYEVII